MALIPNVKACLNKLLIKKKNLKRIADSLQMPIPWYDLKGLFGFWDNFVRHKLLIKKNLKRE